MITGIRVDIAVQPTPLALISPGPLASLGFKSPAYYGELLRCRNSNGLVMADALLILSIFPGLIIIPAVVVGVASAFKEFRECGDRPPPLPR